MAQAANPVQPQTGSIAWLEIRVTNLARAQRFYSALFGWTIQPVGPIVALFSAPNIEGMLNQEAGHRPASSTMIACFQVASVSAACAEAVRLGGRIEVTPRPIPGKKKSFCMVKDPEENILGLVSDEPNP